MGERLTPVEQKKAKLCQWWRLMLSNTPETALNLPHNAQGCSRADARARDAQQARMVEKTAISRKNDELKAAGIEPAKFRESVEKCLVPLVAQFVPEGSTPQAVADQWAHAIAHNEMLFGANREADAATAMKLLADNGLFVNRDHLAESLSAGLPIQPKPRSTFSFIDLFAGIGGMRIGFQQAGGRCVFSSEFEKNAQKTYFENHGEFPFGDITKIAAEDIPDHDVLVAGFPCQPFSHAGLKLGIDDTRGTLFHDIARIMEVKRPKVALLENVKGLVSHDKGYTLQVILRKLTAIGYKCNISTELIAAESLTAVQAAAKKMVLRSLDFGVPQNRQCIYFVLFCPKATSRYRGLT